MKKICFIFIILVAHSVAVVAQSTTVKSARSLIEKEHLEGHELERVKFSFISLLAIASNNDPSLVQGPALRQTAIGDLSDLIKDGDIFWEVKYYNANTHLISMITFVNEKTQKVFFLCRSYSECAGK